MALVTWDDEEYSVGVDLYDEQHQNLFDMLNELHDAMKEGRGKDAASEILAEMAEYTEYHFDSEERYMGEHGYDGLEEHEVRHEKFVGRVAEFRSDLDDGKLSLFMELLDFLKDWLANHIQKTDEKYRDFFQGLEAEMT